MADTPHDPMATWRDMLGAWEKNVNSFANKAMEQEDFARLMGTATGATSMAQGALTDLMQRTLATMNLPSRADLASIGERLQAMEAQLGHLTQLVQSIPGVGTPASSAAPKPSRTRQPPPASSENRS